MVDSAAELFRSRGSSSSAVAETAETTTFTIAKAAAAAAESSAEAASAAAIDPTSEGGSSSSGSHTRREAARAEKAEKAEQAESFEGQIFGLEDLPRMGPAGTLPALWPACSESGTGAVKAQSVWEDDMFTGWGSEAEQGTYALHVRYDLEERERELAVYVAQTCPGISVPPRPRVVRPVVSRARRRKNSRDRLGLRMEHVVAAVATPRARSRPIKQN